jgi:hypothetical protein
MTKVEINKVRDYYGLPSTVSDSQIKSELKDSLGIGIIRIEVAKKNLSKALKEVLPKWIIN